MMVRPQIKDRPLASTVTTPAADSAPEPLQDRSVKPIAGKPGGVGGRGGRRRSIMDRLDAFISRLSTRNNFWHRLCSLFWLPYAFRSGIRIKKIDDKTFGAVLPFKKFNRNWYNAMAGAALLANSEIAGGLYVFGIVGAEYTVVCKNLQYRFLRPCLGPALYRMEPTEDINDLVSTGGEFDVTLEMNIVQQIHKPGGKEKRIGRCTALFHVTPKAHQQRKGRRVR